MKLLLDTDIGSNIDDALCLAYLLAHEDCELLGITTTGGETKARARLASALCRSAGHAVPIFPGPEAPSDASSGARGRPLASGDLRWPHQERFPDDQAIELMHASIAAASGEVTLLAIGPLTNVALLIQLDPSISSRLARLVIMGGVFWPRRRSIEPFEANTSADPQAARVCYAAAVPVHRTLGLDVTRRATASPQELSSRLAGSRFAPLLDWLGSLVGTGDSVALNDPLAAVSLFDDVCRYERGSVSVRPVSTGPGRRRYADTRFRPDETGPHEVATDVDVERFLRQFLDVLGA